MARSAVSLFSTSRSISSAFEWSSESRTSLPERRAAFIAAVTSRLLGTPGDDDAAAPETLPFFPLSDGDLAADEWGESRPPPERRVLEYFAAGASGDSGSALIASAAARTDAAADPDRPPVATWSSLR